MPVQDNTSLVGSQSLRRSGPLGSRQRSVARFGTGFSMCEHPALVWESNKGVTMLVRIPRRVLAAHRWIFVAATALLLGLGLVLPSAMAKPVSLTV
jgi:hypothetical protein